MLRNNLYVILFVSFPLIMKIELMSNAEYDPFLTLCYVRSANRQFHRFRVGTPVQLILFNCGFSSVPKEASIRCVAPDSAPIKMSSLSLFLSSY